MLIQKRKALTSKYMLVMCLNLVDLLDEKQYNYKETAEDINEDFISNMLPAQFQLYMMGKQIERGQAFTSLDVKVEETK
jgi:hypothetical protein